MKQIAFCYNKFQDWYYFVKINKKSITFQRGKRWGKREPSVDFKDNYKGTLEEYMEPFSEDNVVLMRFYE